MTDKAAIARQGDGKRRQSNDSGSRHQSLSVRAVIGQDRLQARHSAPDPDTEELEAERLAEQMLARDGSSKDISAGVDADATTHNRAPATLSTRAIPRTAQADQGIAQAQQKSSDTGSSVEQAVREERGKGRPLPDSVRAPYESHLARDFSAVRIHTDSRADELCSRVKAQALTYGRDIYFRQGHYSPATRHGRLVLGHELAHVVQQGRAASKVVQARSDNDAMVVPEGLPTDRQNDRQDEQVQRHTTPGQAGSEPGAVQREQQQARDQLTETPQVIDQQPQTDDDAVVVELPELQIPPREAVAKVESLSLQGASDQALLGYIDASPSSMAATQPMLASSLDSKLNAEARQAAEDVPVLAAQASGQTDLATVDPMATDAGVNFQPADQGAGSDPGEIRPQPHENDAPAPDNRESRQLLDQQGQSGLLGWLRSNFSGFLSRIQTRDDGLSTSAGERQTVELSGHADPNRASDNRSEAVGTLGTQRDQTNSVFQQHPGQNNIQAKAVNEEKKPQLSPQSSETISAMPDQGMADYVAMPLPEDVRLQSDKLLQPGISEGLTESRQQAEDAADQREQGRQQAVDQAQRDADALNQQADVEQRDIVLSNREKVAEQQRQGIAEANSAVETFNKDAATEQQTLNESVSGRVAESEEAAAKELEKGETEAEAKRLEGEREAAAKKRELEREQEDDSWWDRAVDAVKSAVNAITEAIDAVFNKIREAVKDIIDAAKQLAVDAINAARDWVVEQLDDFRDWVKDKVDTYLKDTFPNLANRINGAIDTVVDGAVSAVNAVADNLIAGVEALADGLAAALDKVLSTFQTALKAGVQIVGAVLTGDFAGALRVAVQAACDIAGIDSQPIFDFFDRAGSLITTILMDPVAFFMNIVAGVGGGVRNFASNIKKHLINGLVGWLTGALSEVAITLPEKFEFNFKTVLSLSMQILGLTYDNIKARVIKRLPAAAKVIDAIEKGVDIIRRIVTEGPIAIWNMVKESVANLKDMVLSGIRDFVIVTVVKEAVGWLIGLLNPAGAIVKVVKLLYDFTMFLIQRFQQIKDFVGSVYEGVAAIASGQLGKIMGSVEDAMARSLPVVISLLASLAGLGGIGKTVQNIIRKISDPVNKVIEAIIDKVVSFAERLLGKGTKDDKKAEKDSGKTGDGLGAVNLADLDKPPVSAKRTPTESKAQLQRVKQLLSLVGKDAKTTDDVERHFPKIKKRYRLQKIAYDKTAPGKLGIRIKINPEEVFSNFPTAMAVKADDGAEAVANLNQPKIEASPVSLAFNGKTYSSKAGQKMVAEHLGPNHPKGSETSGNELQKVFDVLPTRKKVATNYTANQVYIRGHLLNAQLGGPAEDRNLFPITQQANSDHHSKIESKAKELVNTKGLLVYYSVTVKQPSTGVKNGFPYVNSVFDCELATYHLTSSGSLEKNDSNKQTARIESNFDAPSTATASGEAKEQGVKQQNFDPASVKLASNKTVKYLTEMSEQELTAIPGIGNTSAKRIMTKLKAGSIRSNEQLRELIKTRQWNALQAAGFDLRLYRQ